MELLNLDKTIELLNIISTDMEYKLETRCAALEASINLMKVKSLLKGGIS